ncbi:MAG TPA: monovalent cation/H+ antiporter complex subunit F [Acidimicrobiia bacterium]|nr:monovalent cation/H+ antiporter complex subunit F [Acidimicrobiia bacterium]
MTIAVAVAGALLVVAAVPAVIRAAIGPSIADRMVALDTLVFIGVGGIGLYIVQTGDVTYVPVLVIAVVTAFVSTIVVARYIETERPR